MYTYCKRFAHHNWQQKKIQEKEVRRKKKKNDQK